MGRWLTITGGLLIWAAHFFGVYLIASAGDVVARADAPEWRLGGLVFSGACALAATGFIVGLVRRSRRAARRGTPDPGRGLALEAGALGGVLGLIGIVFQALPNVVGY